MKLVLSAHQPDLFPYPGFFHKMLKSDYFDMAIYDTYSRGRYMDRVRMGHIKQLAWVNVPIKRKTETPINEIRLKKNWKDLLLVRIHRQYQRFKFYDLRKHIVERVVDKNCRTLAEVGEESILSIKDFLHIKTRIDCLGKHLPKGTFGLIEICRRYENKYCIEVSYLSGIGGKKYIDQSKFYAAGIDLSYVNFKTDYLCSMLTPIFQLLNPRRVIE